MKAATKLEEEARMAFEEKERKMRERQKKTEGSARKDGMSEGDGELHIHRSNGFRWQCFEID